MTALAVDTLKSPYECGKRGYASKAAAKRARRRACHLQTRPYFCDDCRYWHLGHLGDTVTGGFMSREERFKNDGLRRSA